MAIVKFRPRALTMNRENSACRILIPAYDYLLRYAIEQAGLDASVLSISQREIVDEQLRGLAPNGVVLDRADGAFLLSVSAQLQSRTDVENASLANALKDCGLQLIERDAADIQNEPLFGNVRAVWSHERYHVPLLDKLKFSAALAEDESLSLVDLETRARPDCDTLAAMCAMACRGLVQLELHHTLGPHTIVSARRRERK